MIDGLTFQADGHVYRYKGSVVPSVTQVLDQLQYLQGIPWHVLEAAAEFGTHVHQACHLYNQNDLIEEDLHPALAPYLNGYKRFLGETGFVVHQSELLVYNATARYAGQLDFTGNFRGTTWVVDIKSGIIPSTVGAQVAAYQQAIPAQGRPKKRACLQLLPGDYKFIEQKEVSDFSLFTSALNCYRHNQKFNPRAMGAISGGTYANRISEPA
jgi:hypothetical protein